MERHLETYRSYKEELLDWYDRVIKLVGVDNEEESRGGLDDHAQLKAKIDAFEDELKDIEENLEPEATLEKINRLQDSSQALYEEWSALYALEESDDNNEIRNEDNQIDEEDLINRQEVQQQSVEPVAMRRVPIGKHTLPPLPYAYDALEPYISAEIMRLHHSEHHQGYVDGLNKAEKEMEKSRKSGDFDLIKHWEREAAFNGAGHYLHTIFWNIMSPRGGGQPRREVATQINQDFGSFKRFKQHFSEAAKKVEAVGWAILVWAPRSHRLEILQAEKHQNLSQWDVIPLLVLDVWEHAYYLQYKTDKGQYVENWWNVVDWDAVNQRFLQARTLRWQPY
ncbi:superoxide dismutase [Desertibacillus haloalkaliphilus]|uniref:superoxide dismutase n=1 Tax=Desertibacillus haloalkaliphilus TaxID=1328930 RepID=UPI001C252E7B|nr:superoxide dismutase [Desertibacillus haloalkaliphilus]MBU8907160.1 superoxide dismutase [Desertibacillus haloalkaliphilus]